MTAAETTKLRLPPPGRLTRLWPRVQPYRGQLLLATLALLAGVTTVSWAPLWRRRWSLRPLILVPRNIPSPTWRLRVRRP